MAAVVAADRLVHWATGDMTLRIRRLFFLRSSDALGGRGRVGRPIDLPRRKGPPASSYRLPIDAQRSSLLGRRGFRQLWQRPPVLHRAAAWPGLSLPFPHSAWATPLLNLDSLCWSNRGQTAAIAQVCWLVGPDETVLDGYTGLGAFRHHAYYYWWLNPYSLKLMPPAAPQNRICLQA